MIPWKELILVLFTIPAIELLRHLYHRGKISIIVGKYVSPWENLYHRGKICIIVGKFVYTWENLYYREKIIITVGRYLLSCENIDQV